LWAGGCIGEIREYVSFENVRSLGGTVTVEQTDTENGGQQSYIGGFAGYLAGSTVNGSFSNTAVTVTENFGTHSRSSVGGFIGCLYIVSASEEIINCYATGNVTVSSQAGELFVGGLLGRVDGTGSGLLVEQCYAAGEVSAAGRGNINAGGLIGMAWAGTQVANCYALGNVLADMTLLAGSGWTYVGGLVGYTSHTGNSIEHCFAGGAVIARSNASSGDGISIGGIAGYIRSNVGGPGTCTITNNAAFGPSVTGKGSPTRNLGRIGGWVQAGEATLADNYALADMRLEASAGYDDLNPPLYTPPASDVGADKKNGANAAASSFKTASFWTGTLGFNGAGTYTGTTPPWNMNGVGRGYPTLAGMGGQ
jgi:hypothetical protein